MLLVGFTAGQVQLIDPIKKELSTLYNDVVPSWNRGVEKLLCEVLLKLKGVLVGKLFCSFSNPIISLYIMISIQYDKYEEKHIVFPPQFV